MGVRGRGGTKEMAGRHRELYKNKTIIIVSER